MTSRTEIVQKMLDGYDLGAGECCDLAYELLKRSGQSPDTLREIQNIILLSFSRVANVKVVNQIPPDGDDEDE